MGYGGLRLVSVYARVSVSSVVDFWSYICYSRRDHSGNIIWLQAHGCAQLIESMFVFLFEVYHLPVLCEASQPMSAWFLLAISNTLQHYLSARITLSE